MSEFMHSASLVHAIGSSDLPVRFQDRDRARARSLNPPMNKHVVKSASTSHLGKVDLSRFESDSDMNTIPDPRTPQPKSPLSRNNSASDPSPHPDLSQEVATLSTKLVNAINHQDTLDNALQRTRHELDATKERMLEYEKRVEEHEGLMSTGKLVEKEVYEKMEKQLLSELQEERRRRTEAEKAKRKTDAEIETLTQALFEEANTMVAAARKETEAAEKRNDQLKQQLADAELLQMSLQEQLQDLKAVMEKMSERDELDSATLPTTTAPSTPGVTPADKMNKLFEAANLTPNTPGNDDMTPEHPLHFHHLLHPVLRTDLQSFKDFEDMLKISTRSAPSSRVSSGNYSSLNVLGLGSFSNNSTSSLTNNGRPPSVGNSSPRDPVSATPSLKDEKFYKRAIAEDIEPTLRLDIAPGLSWMARRTVLNSISAGSLVVEPSPPPNKIHGPFFPCSLCGEGRKGEKYARKFRFKSSETDETKHPLCDWCLGRLRATCDYIGFLRMIAAGHWRAETEQEKKNTWEESVRLRERMFWARIGGGVVPAFVPLKDTPRSDSFASASVKDRDREAVRQSEESTISEAKLLDSAVDMSEVRKSEDDPFRSKEEDKGKRVSIGKTIIEQDGSSASTTKTASPLTQEEEDKIAKEAQEQLENEVRKSLESAGRQRSVSTPATPEKKEKREKEERLSLAIPGAFD